FGFLTPALIPTAKRSAVLFGIGLEFWPEAVLTGVSGGRFRDPDKGAHHAPHYRSAGHFPGATEWRRVARPLRRGVRRGRPYQQQELADQTHCLAPASLGR